MSTSKPPIYENNPKYAPTAFQQAQSTSSSSIATPYYVTSPSETPYPPPSSIQPQQSQSFSNQSVQPYQSPLYPTSSQAVAVPPYPSSSQQSIFPQPHVPTSVQQQSTPQPYGVQQQYPHAGQNPYMNPYQYPQAAPGMQVLRIEYLGYPGYPGYTPQYYSNYPVMYGSGCHGYRRSSSCCSD
ncbi:hypothetical protein GCK32_009412 [Trichostrongylus colubriformis]|uniref:Uncharacterized protein n=1 Tax=Trichostrongylus colubriformis TaxID=6319 RepID=A0AAN8F2G6_TRICO